jgi:hypothetical protein
VSIIAQPKRRVATSLRVSIWSAFLLVLVAPLFFQRTGHPYYGALILRPGSWLVAKIAPSVASDRAIVLVNFLLYLIVIYALIRFVRSRGQSN